MIDPHADRTRSARRLWSGYVQRLFRTLDLHGRVGAEEISESLAVFCEQHPHMPAHTLSLLMARSFCATGDRDAAGKILWNDRTHRPHAGSWLDVLSAEYPFPELYPLFSSRALRPLQLKTVGEQALWVLDLEKVHLTAADRHEMILLQTLRTLTEKISNVWKKSNGQGTMAVKGLSRLRPVFNPRSTGRLPGYLSAVLTRRAAQCGWAAVPSVLLLDL